MTAPRRRGRASAAALAAAWVAGSGLAGAGEPPAEAAPARLPKAIFLSGHSLIDRPIPDDLAGLMAGAGHPVTWQRQHRIGSSIAERSSEEGMDRAGRPIAAGLDVFAAAEAPYDTLIVTEQHVLPATLLWNDTARMLRRLHDRFAARDASGTTFFYVPWMALDDKDDPRRWIAYERAAAPVWTCLAAAAEGGPEAAGRRGRIVPLPAALALSDLIAAATEGAGLPGITQATTRETVDLLIVDDVHPTRLGSYYLALVVFSAITGRAAEAGSDPEGVPRIQARALEAFVRQASPGWNAARPDLDRCAASLRQGAMGDLWAYVERAHWRKERGYLAARWARLRQGAQWRLLLWREPAWNPFRLPD